MTTLQQRETRVEVVKEDTGIKQELVDKQVALPQAVKEIKEDWIELDVPIRESSVVPPGTNTPLFYLCHLYLAINNQNAYFAF